VAVISVITVAAFDAPRLSKTLTSVSQILSNDIEQIVVYPQADRKSKHLVDSFASKSHYLKFANDTGAGIYPAMNLGLSHATGSYCWFVNCGDEVLKENIPDLLRNIETSKPTWLIGQGVFNWRDPQIMTSANLKNFVEFYKEAFISHQTVIAKVAQVLSLGGFNTNFKVAADTDLILRMAKISEPLWFKKNVVIVEQPNFASKFNRLARVESLKIAIMNRNLIAVFRILLHEVLNLCKRVSRGTF
jgi:hypothetical protein